MPRLNEAQSIAYCLSHVEDVKEVHMVTGVGVGKTYTLGVWMIPFLSIRGSLGLVCAPTVPMLRNATLPGILSAWEDYGLTQEKDFVINKRFKGVPAYSGIGSDNVITFRWGSYVVLTSMENYNTVNGSQWDYIVGDEERDWRHFEEAMGKVRARQRGKLFRQLGIKSKYLGATTPPDNPLYHIKLRDSQETNDNIRLVHATSYMNEENLPVDYIKSLEDTYDPMTFRREVMGELIIAKGSQWLCCLDEDIHVIPFIQVKPKEQVFLSFDFNVSPLTCVAVQNANGEIRFVKEFRLINSDVTAMAMAIKKWLRDNFGSDDVGRLVITGDASGNNRTSISVGESNWNRLIGDLGVHPAQLRILTENPGHMDSLQLTNSIMAKHGNILISSRECPHLLEDCRFVQRDDNCGLVPPDKMHGHLLDCLRYYFWTFHFDFLRKFADRTRNFRSFGKTN